MKRTRFPPPEDRHALEKHLRLSLLGHRAALAAVPVGCLVEYGVRKLVAGRHHQGDLLLGKK